ncbi:MAG: hypothetical protein VZR23_05890 [Lachnospiraceae bacterium]|nr:hypothetical protein [Lachnospiraceae bacterium]
MKYNMRELETRYYARAEGKAEGKAENIVYTVDNLINNTNESLDKACSILGLSIKDYEDAKELMDSMVIADKVFEGDVLYGSKKS